MDDGFVSDCQPLALGTAFWQAVADDAALLDVVGFSDEQFFALLPLVDFMRPYDFFAVASDLEARFPGLDVKALSGLIRRLGFERVTGFRLLWQGGHILPVELCHFSALRPHE